MTKTEYGKYLQSTHWKKLRAEVIEGSENKCEQCDIPRWLAEIAYDQDLHVHHLSYENLGNEEWDELEVLCRRCHDIETFGRSELRKPTEATCGVCGGKHWNPRSALCVVCAELTGDGNFSFHFRVTDIDPNTRNPIWHRLLSEIMCGVPACTTEEKANIIIQHVEKIRDNAIAWRIASEFDKQEIPF